MNNLKTALGIFILLFLLASGMLVYYQFYQGHGAWRFTLLHKSNDTTFLLALKNKNNGFPVTKEVQNAKRLPDSTRDIAKSDSILKQKSANPVNYTQPDSIGTVYEVQIGTFYDYELKKYDAVFNNLHEEKGGKQTRLTLGQFKTGIAADGFKKDMMKLGIKDAWVVKKVNGKKAKNQ